MCSPGLVYSCEHVHVCERTRARVCVCTIFLFSLLQKIKGDKVTSVPDCTAWGKKGVLAASTISSYSTSANCTFQRNVNYVQLHRTDDAISLDPQQQSQPRELTGFYDECNIIINCVVNENMEIFYEIIGNGGRAKKINCDHNKLCKSESIINTLFFPHFVCFRFIVLLR